MNPLKTNERRGTEPLVLHVPHQLLELALLIIFEHLKTIIWKPGCISVRHYEIDYFFHLPVAISRINELQTPA